MKFSGAWVASGNDHVCVTFTAFDETDLTPVSRWTETWQNEDSQAPAGFIHPAMIVAEAGRRLLELRPELAERSRSFMATFEEPRESGGPARAIELRDAEQFGLLCLSLCDSIAALTRSRAPAAQEDPKDGSQDQIPF